MSPIEVLHFLLPDFSEILQLVFFAIIIAMMVFTAVSAHKTARPESWERKWNRGTPNDHSDDLDIEHGSVTDLWHAVATAPEKLAEIMPGMLLVVGLLGTFIGLGLALNHASNILGQANALSAGAAADSMQNLMGLLQGLGTKFKTSTWGILGFVLLKIWSELTRFEEKRLTWVIGKVKAELENRKQGQSAAASARQEALLTKIGDATNGIVGGMAQQIALLIQNQKVLQRHAMQQIEQSTKEIREDLGHVHAETHAMSAAMAQFTTGTQGVVENMADAAQRMAGGADKVGTGASELVGAIRAFEEQFTDVLDKVRKDLGTAIHDMSTQASSTLERGSAQLGDATREISTALGVLSEDVKQTMGEVKGSIEKALGIQKKAAEAFTASNVALTENIAMTTNTVEKLAKPIEDGLQSISNSSLNMRNLGKTWEKSAESLKEVVVHLDGLPAALLPLAAIPVEQRELLASLKPLHEMSDKQGELLSSLKPLGASVGLQEAILLELQKLQRELKSRDSGVQPPHAEAA